MQKTIKFGVIGCGLMGREFASAAARWCHLNVKGPRPDLVAVCDTNKAATQWFSDNFPSVRFVETDYQALLSHKEIEAVYCALPHSLHAQVYCDIIRSGKHLFGEKPFGIDLAANEQIQTAMAENPAVMVRCASEFPYYPACQTLISWAKQGRLGKILEVRSGFHHSSDMDLEKPINWKRTVAICGEYGCMGDLGIHTQHVPFRLGWTPKRVHASLWNHVPQRRNADGGFSPCETWDNAVLTCQAEDQEGSCFPLIFSMKRMSPGATNRWFLEVDAQSVSVRFSTDDPGAFYYTQACGHEQAWCRLNVGYKPLFPTVTGGIFEFGFTDAILQMWCAFLQELDGQEVAFGCFTPAETLLSHRLLTAALASHREKREILL